MNKKEQKQNEAKITLLDHIITPTIKLLIVIKSVSQSGMSRRMRVLVDNRDISYLVADLCDLPINDKGLKIDGCGMDMTFWLANNITYQLWGKEMPLGFTGNGGTCLDWVAI